METLFGLRQQQTVSAKTLLDFSHLTPRIKNHLVQVYSTLAATIAMSAVGAYLGIQFQLSMGAMGLMTFVSLLALMFVSREKSNARMGLMLAFGFFKGATLSPLIEFTLHSNPNILTLAFASTCIIFACFTGSALLSNRREYIFLGGFLSSAISILFWLGMFNMFISTSAIPWLSLYGGLLIFCLYVLYDTQLIVEKCAMGSDDHISHALELYVDFVAIFVRILIILNKNQEKKERRRRND